MGGSGGTAQQDEDAARAGIDAVGLSTTPSAALHKDAGKGARRRENRRGGVCPFVVP